MLRIDTVRPLDSERINDTSAWVCQPDNRHAYCLLGNHFHLLLFSGSGRLSDAMRFLGVTQRINYRDGRDGPIFRGRFTSVAIESDAHLMQVSLYIHRNPVEAGLVAEPWQWPWSSAQAYVGLVRTPAWLHTEAILEMLGPQDARQKYRELLGEETDASGSGGQTLRV